MSCPARQWEFFDELRWALRDRTVEVPDGTYEQKDYPLAWIVDKLALFYGACMVVGPVLVADPLHWKGWRLLWLIPLWLVSIASGDCVFGVAETIKNWEKRNEQRG